MSGLGKTVVKKLGDKEVICRELTVGSVRQLLATESSYDIVSDGLFEDIRLADFALLTSLTADEIEVMLPSELAVVVEGCKEANPDFFGLLARREGFTSRASCGICLAW